jgi:GxxExxY protein
MDKNNNYLYSEITEIIIGEAYIVHKTLGSGFLEKVYENSLLKRLKDKNLIVKQQYPISVYFENLIVGEYSADLFVDNKVIVELKAVENIIPVFETQLVNYLKATGVEVGLLLNFGKKLDIKRKVYTLNVNR